MGKTRALSMLVAVLGPPFCAAAQLSSEQESALLALARGKPVHWVELNPEQGGQLLAKVEDCLSNFQKYHLPHGLCVDIWWKDRTRSDPSRYEGMGDSACSSGHYLAALALRYHVTMNAKTRTDILAVLDAFDVLTRVTGIEGYVARYAGPADSAPYREYYRQFGRGEDPDRPGLGRSAYRGAPPYEALVWLGDSSRDTYDGILLGLASVWVYVPQPEIRERVGEIAERIINRLIADDWQIADPAHRHSTGATPLFKAAWLRFALSVNRNKYATLESQYRSLLEWLTLVPLTVCSKWDQEYFANNLAFIRLFVLNILEEDNVRRQFLRRVLINTFEKVRDHLNAHFAAICLLAGDPHDASARAMVQGMLYDFPIAPVWARAVEHRAPTNIPAHGADHVEFALLTHDRVPSDFLWQRSPCLRHGSWDLPVEYPGLDLLLPYWMARVAGAIPGPDGSFVEDCAFVCVDFQPTVRKHLTDEQLPAPWRQAGFTAQDVNTAIDFQIDIALPNARRVADACRQLQLPLIFIHWGHLFSDGMDLDPEVRRVFLQEHGTDHTAWPHHISRSDSRPSPELGVRPGEYVLPKTAQDAFRSSNLEFVLRNLGVQNIVFVGGHTGACLGKSAASAKKLGFRILCVEDATFDARESSRLPNLLATGYDYVVTADEFVRLADARNAADNP